MQTLHVLCVEIHRFIGQQSVAADKSYYQHYQPSANCLKRADDQGRLYLSIKRRGI